MTVNYPLIGNMKKKYSNYELNFYILVMHLIKHVGQMQHDCKSLHFGYFMIYLIKVHVKLNDLLKTQWSIK